MPRKRAGKRSGASKWAGLPIAPSDGTDAQSARKRARRAEREDPEYLAWIRLQACVVGEDCRGPVESHHEPPKSHAGDWCDASSLPLCSRHHTQRHHVLGPRLFQEKYGISLLAKALEYRGKFVKEKA